MHDLLGGLFSFQKRKLLWKTIDAVILTYHKISFVLSIF